MKLVVIFFVLITTLSFVEISKRNLMSINNVIICDSIPPINKNIIALVKSKIGKKVGKGECWDLAADALNSVGAKWDGNYGFGKEVNYKKDCIYPGDIIQFEGVILKYEIDKKQYIEKMAHHTAIIYEVKGKDEFVIADQNNGRTGRKVGLGALDIKTITKGKFKIFRPTN